jgi:hypothetical protein
MKWFMVVFMLIHGQPKEAILEGVPRGPFDSRAQCEKAVEAVAMKEGAAGAPLKRVGGGYTVKLDEVKNGASEMRALCSQMGAL